MTQKVFISGIADFLGSHLGDRFSDRGWRVYGLAKHTSELMVENLFTTHGGEYAIAVPHSIFGPRQRGSGTDGIQLRYGDRDSLGRDPQTWLNRLN
jgi:nucleoside-diphosphate-sugar epimerase